MARFFLEIKCKEYNCLKIRHL